MAASKYGMVGMDGERGAGRDMAHLNRISGRVSPTTYLVTNPESECDGDMPARVRPAAAHQSRGRRERNRPMHPDREGYDVPYKQQQERLPVRRREC